MKFAGGVIILVPAKELRTVDARLQKNGNRIRVCRLAEHTA